MAENSLSGKRVAKPADGANTTASSDKSGALGTAEPDRAEGVSEAPAALSDKSAPRRAPATSTAALNAMSASLAPPAPQPTVKCPKCGTAVREVARFCQRCHATMRYDCPACGNKQRTGGKCEKCGVDFIKYIGAVVAPKQAEADAIYDKLEQRSTLMKNLLVIPLTGGFSLIRQILGGRDRKS